MQIGHPKPNPLAVRAWKLHRKSVSGSALALHLGVSRPAVSKWPYVPEKRVLAVSQFMNLPPSSLRPDIYPPDPWANL